MLQSFIQKMNVFISWTLPLVKENHFRGNNKNDQLKLFQKLKPNSSQPHAGLFNDQRGTGVISMAEQLLVKSE